MPPFLRSAIAIFSGFMVMSVVLMFKPLMLRGFNPPNTSLTLGYLAANAVVVFLAVGLGGYVTAFIAQYRPIEHAAVLGGLVFLLNWLAYRHLSGLPVWYIWFMGCVPPFIVLTAAAFYKEKARPQNA